MQLEITPMDGTVRGRLAVEGELPSEFYGWFELINMLDTAAHSFWPQPKANR